MKMEGQKIGKFIAQLRKEQGLTQQQLGDRLGVTNKTVSRWETENYMPPVEILTELSEYFNVSINEILAGKRLEENEYKEIAEENLKMTLTSQNEQEINRNIIKTSKMIFALVICLVIGFACFEVIDEKKSKVAFHEFLQNFRETDVTDDVSAIGRDPNSTTYFIERELADNEIKELVSLMNQIPLAQIEKGNETNGNTRSVTLYVHTNESTYFLICNHEQVSFDYDFQLDEKYSHRTWITNNKEIIQFIMNLEKEARG